VTDSKGFTPFESVFLPSNFEYSNRAIRSRLSNRTVTLKCFNYSSFSSHVAEMEASKDFEEVDSSQPLQVESCSQRWDTSHGVL